MTSRNPNTESLKAELLPGTEMISAQAVGQGPRGATAGLSFAFLTKRHVAGICLVLFALVVGVYLPSLKNGFVDYDDPVYATANPHVQNGLTWQGVRWAFTALHAGFWHPVTWISHMLDCQLFGLSPGGHHLTGLLLHATNTVLLFVLFRRMTGTSWRSAFVAALFGLHPQHVESVAWVAERKDVLSTFFWILALLAYVRYAHTEKRKPEGESSFGPAGRSAVLAVLLSPSSLYYILSLLFFALALMSKAMVVTLPLVMLLLDYWPLRRFELETQSSRLKALLPLVWEKLPFLVLGCAIGLLTLRAESGAGALRSTAEFPVAHRFGNALVSYVIYLAQMVWPASLAVYYPLPPAYSPELILGAAMLLATATILAVWLGRTRPYLATGWFWYLVTLLPVSELVQIGTHSRADRYTYVPMTGIFVVLAWGLHELTSHWRRRVLILSASGLVALAFCIALTSRQLGFWKDSETLFRHALASTKDNDFAHENLGETLLAQGRVDEALSHFQEAVRLRPDFIAAHINLGAALQKKGLLDQAAREYQEALRLKPDWPEAYCDLGLVALQKGHPDEALVRFREAVTIQPDYADGHYNLGNLLVEQGETEEALAHYQMALELTPNDVSVLNSLAWIRAASAEARFRNGVEAVRLAERACRAAGTAEPASLRTLGAAYAEAGRFEEAMAAEEKAGELARALGQEELAAKSRQLYELFRSRKPYREP